MILVFGGTTEGRMAIKTLDEGVGQYYYSTRDGYQEVECAHGDLVSGEMSETGMKEFCGTHNIKLLIDAAHPFAVNLHATVGKVARSLNLPAVRLERRYPDVNLENVIWCDSYEEAVEAMEREGVKRLLALTGVQTMTKLKSFWIRHDTYFRILDRRDSWDKAVAAGFPKDHLVFYEENDLSRIVSEVVPDAIITKESGLSGGFQEKIDVALQYACKVYVVRRPTLPDNFIEVDGVHGLRREVERIIPEFYSLHTGFTTGSCATAAAKAALIGLLTGEKVSEIKFKIPEGETMKMAVESVEISHGTACASVIKDAGDDPDVTDGSRITVTVKYAFHPGIEFKGGKGVGTVTLPGLGLDVGEPAINVVPRQMMINELSSLYHGGLDVTVDLEDGDMLAAKTFNPKVGVVGGVSIIGTTGIVRPFSHEAFVESMRREVGVAIALKCDRIVVNSGGKSERFMKTIYPELLPQAFIHYGNAIGDIMEIARDMNVKAVTIGLMLGKAVKLAEGHMDTHSHRITFNKDFLKEVALGAQCSPEALNAIEQLNLARELPTLLNDCDASRFFAAIGKLCHEHCADIYNGSLRTVLMADDGKILNTTSDL